MISTDDLLTRLEGLTNDAVAIGHQGMQQGQRLMQPEGVPDEQVVNGILDLVSECTTLAQNIIQLRLDVVR